MLLSDAYKISEVYEVEKIKSHDFFTESPYQYIYITKAAKMGRNSRNLLITMAVIGGMLLAMNFILKDYLYYRKVQKNQNLESVNRYLGEFPKGIYAKEARELQDEYSFAEAKKLGSAEAYDNYIKKFEEEGKYLEEARKQAEALHFESLSQRSDLEEIIRFLKRFPDSKYQTELQQLEKELWTNYLSSFNASAKNHGYHQKSIDALNALFNYMQSNRFTHLYISSQYSEDNLKDWIDYPQEVRLIWENQDNLQLAFDRSLIPLSFMQSKFDSSLMLPTQLRLPSDNPPLSVKSYMNTNDIYRIISELPKRLNSELKKAFDFPKIHLVRSNEIPKDAPSITINCYPINKEIQVGDIKSPYFYMRLRTRSSNSRRSPSDISATIFNGYMMAINIEWSMQFHHGDEAQKPLFSMTLPTRLSTHYLNKSNVRKEYNKMVETSFKQFSQALAKETNINLSIKD